MKDGRKRRWQDDKRVQSGRKEIREAEGRKEKGVRGGQSGE